MNNEQSVEPKVAADQDDQTTVTVTFRFPFSAGVNRVDLVRPGAPPQKLNLEHHSWTADVRLPPGTHRYRFQINERRFEHDASNPYRVTENDEVWSVHKVTPRINPSEQIIKALAITCVACAL